MSRQHDLLTRLVKLTEEATRTKAQIDQTWTDVFIMADEVAGVNEPYRFLDGQERMVMGRIMAQPAARLDEAPFLTSLTSGQKRACTRKTTVYVIVPELLEIAVAKDPDLKAKVAQNMTVPERTARRHGPRPANKEELAELDAAL